MSKFDKVYKNFLFEQNQRPVKNVTPGKEPYNVVPYDPAKAKQSRNQYSLTPVPSAEIGRARRMINVTPRPIVPVQPQNAIPAQPTPNAGAKSPSFSDRYKRFQDEIKTYANKYGPQAAKFATNLANAVASIGGYTEPIKVLNIAVQSTKLLKDFIDGEIAANRTAPPTAADPNYIYYNLSTGDNLQRFIDVLRKLNVEATKRLDRQISALDNTKNNYISVTGVTSDTPEIYISKIGNEIFASYRIK